MPNIAIFSPNQNPYSETFIQAHKNYLKGTVFYYYGIEGNIKLEKQRQALPRFNNLGKKVMRKLLNKPYYSLWSEPIIASIQKNKIDSVLVEYGTHAFHLLPVLEKLNIPIVVHFHGYDASILDVIASCNKYKEVFMVAHKIIAVSRVMEQKLLDLGCPKEKVVYNVYGPQPEFHDVEPNFSKKQFIAIGRFTDKKAPYYTILAFKEVVKKYPDAKLLLAGNGELVPVCENLVRYYRLEKNIEFLGVITPASYRKLLSESLAFVQHSITAKNGDMEGTPLAVLEASAAGLPVIATIHAGIPDVIKHGETGLLCAEHDVIQMTNHMLLLLGDMKLAKSMGEKGAKHIILNFSLERHISKFQKLLA